MRLISLQYYAPLAPVNVRNKLDKGTFYNTSHSGRYIGLGHYDNPTLFLHFPSWGNKNRLHSKPVVLVKIVTIKFQPMGHSLSVRIDL